MTTYLIQKEDRTETPVVPVAATSGIAAADGDIIRFARERLRFDPDARQEEVLRSGARRGILNCTRQWGKSTVMAVKAVHRVWTRPGSLVVVACPTGRQSGEWMRKAAGLVGRLGVKARGDGGNEISLALPNGSRIVGLPGTGTEGGIRGFSAVSMLLIDEAARVEDVVYRALRPMLAVGGGELWMMSTPNGQRGFFWETWAGRDGEFGLAGAALYPEDAGETEPWTRIRVTWEECLRIERRHVADERAKMPEAWFRQEYCCEFTDREDAVFPRHLLEAALSDEVEPLDLEPYR